MTRFPETQNSLLVRIRDPEDREAWSEFAALYRPVIYRMARHRGFQDADAQDLAQKVLMSVSSAIDRFDPEQGRAQFRTWLTRVAQNAIVDAFRRERPDRPGGGTSAFLKLSECTEADSSAEIEREYCRAVFRQAAAAIRPEFEDSTWRAFWLTTVEGLSVSDAAHEVSRTIGSVYAARSRVMRRLKERVQELEDNL